MPFATYTMLASALCTYVATYLQLTLLPVKQRIYATYPLHRITTDSGRSRGRLTSRLCKLIATATSLRSHTTPNVRSYQAKLESLLRTRGCSYVSTPPRLRSLDSLISAFAYSIIQTNGMLLVLDIMQRKYSITDHDGNLIYLSEPGPEASRYTAAQSTTGQGWQPCADHH